MAPRPQLNISGSYNGSAQTSFTVNPGSLISQAGWSLLSADSQETICYNGAATNAFDGNPATPVVTQFCTAAFRRCPTKSRSTWEHPIT